MIINATDEEKKIVINNIKSFMKKHKRYPLKREYDKTFKKFRYEKFGSYTEFQCNLKDEIIEMCKENLKEYAQELGYTPARQRFTRRYGTIYHKYIKYEELVKSAGLRMKKQTEEDILNNIKAFAKKFGRAPTKVEYNRNFRRFNVNIFNGDKCYSSFIERAGLEPKKNWRAIGIKDEEVLDNIKTMIKELGRVPLKAEYEKRFGYHFQKKKLSTFLEKIGYKTTLHRLSERELISRIQTLIVKYKRVTKNRYKTEYNKNFPETRFNFDKMLSKALQDLKNHNRGER